MIRFFVVGTGRCGTTMLRDILNLHPEVYVPTESHWIPTQYELYGRLRNPPESYIDVLMRTFFHTGQRTFDVMAEALNYRPFDLLEVIRDEFAGTTPDLVEFNDQLYALLAAAAHRSIAGDKTPDYSQNLPLLQSLWPQAKFIHMIRDGRDTALSMSKHGGYQRLLSSGTHSWVSLAFDKRYRIVDKPDESHSLEAYIRLWDLRVRRTLAEAAGLPSSCYLEIRYEALLADPLTELRRLACFLRLDPVSDWLAMSARSIRPGNTKKVSDPATYASLTAAASETLARLGYPLLGYSSLHQSPRDELAAPDMPASSLLTIPGEARPIHIPWPNGELHNNDSWRAIGDSSQRSASVVVPVVMDLLGEVRSVVDVGSGTDRWLAEFCGHGALDILGLERPKLSCHLENESRHVAGLHASKPFGLDRGFDLAVSLEFAAHLPEPWAVAFIRSLTQLAPVVLFSAAIPGQGGVGHMNEQWPSYWTAHFAANGFRVVDRVRDKIWRDGRVEWWYRQNLLLFVRQDVLEKYPKINELETLFHRSALDRRMPDTLRNEGRHDDGVERQNPRAQSGEKGTLTVSAVVLSKNGATRIAHCLDSIRQSGFVDEIVVCVDSTTTDQTAEIARQFTPHVHPLDTNGYIESVLWEMTSLCRSEFVLRVDDDECLAGNWSRDPIEALLKNDVTHFFVPRCWVVPPGDAFISTEPWFPDYQLRLFRNKPDQIVWPAEIHKSLVVEGVGLILGDRWLNHYDLLIHSRPAREAKVRVYQTLRPTKSLANFYLYEEQPIELLAADTTGFGTAMRRVGATREDRDGSRSKKTPSRYALGTDMFFHGGGNAAEYTLKGWSHPESWGTWTDGYRAEIWLRLEDPIEKDALMVAVTSAYVRGNHPVLRVRVLCEHKPFGEWSVDSSACVRRTLQVPAMVLANKTDLLFEFQILNPVSPVVLGEATDGRLLGLGFSQFRLECS